MVTIADQASHGLLVIDPACVIQPSTWPTSDRVSASTQYFAERPVTVHVNGVPVVSGDGTAVLGNPLHALTFLVNELCRRGQTLRPGQLVTTGTMTGLKPVPKEADVRVDFAGVGAVSIQLR